jgi:Double zinc ribbon
MFYICIHSLSLSLQDLVTMCICPSCNHKSGAGANYCNSCGTNLRMTKKVCPSCAHQNPAISVYCHACSYQFGGTQGQLSSYQPKFVFSLKQPSLIPEQVKAQFFRFLRQRIFEEQDGRKYADYTGRFYDSRFREIFEIRSRQIVTDILQIHKVHGDGGLAAIDLLCLKSYDGLADFFLIQYCPDLNALRVPAELLKYEKHSPQKPPTWDMLRDFLDFPREQEVFYFDFLSMPEKLLQQAVSSYITAGKGEKLFFICDLSLNGSCREGLAITDQGIYWKLPFGKAKGFRFDMLYEVRKEKNWLVVNENHLVVNPGFDLKLLKFLRKVMPEREVLKNSLRADLVS